MTFARFLVVVSVLGLSSALVAQSTLSAEAQLKAAMNRETVTRDLTGAMEMYRQIAKNFAANHPVASKALLQLGGIYERMGRPEARATYQQIVVDYADTGATYTAARARLNAIQGASPGPFKWRSLDSWLKDAGGVSPSPDGKWLLYTRNRSSASSANPLRQDTFSTYVRDVSRGTERLLINAKTGENPLGNAVWSPDSRRIAGATLVGDALEYRVVTVATGESRTIAKGLVAAPVFSWAPDSRSLAFAVKTSKDDYEQRVIVVGDAGESMLLEATRAVPAAAIWSRDSRQVAYVINGTDADTIRLRTPGSKDAQSIALPKQSAGSRTTLRAWFASGDLWYIRSVEGGNDSYLVSSSGGTSRLICEGRGTSGGDGCQDVSADGTFQIVRKNLTGGGRIVLRSLKDRSEHPLTPEMVLEQTALGGFLPDGRLLGFTSNRDGDYGFYVAPTDALPVSAPIKIVALDSDASSVGGRWTPSGLILRIDNSQRNQYRVDLDPRTGKPVGAPIRLTEDSPINFGARISADGRRIAYISRGRPMGVAVMDWNGVNERVIKQFPPDVLGRVSVLGWLSESDLLISERRQTSRPGASPRTLMRLNAVTGEMREAGPEIEARAVYAIAGGNVFFNGSDNTFSIRPAAGGPVRTIALKDWWDYIAAGQWLAYATGDDSGGRGKPMPGDIRVRSIDTGVERIVVKFADTNEGDHAPLDVSLDGKYLLYQDPSPKLMMANVETGESWPVMETPPAGVDFDYSDARLSPDGTFIVVEGYLSRTTWRLYEGVTYDAIKKLTAAKK